MHQSRNNIYITTKDYLVSGEEFKLVSDPMTEMLITTPQPDLDSLPNYYKHQSYISHSDKSKGLLPFIYYLVKKKALKRKTRLIEKLLKGTGSLLDVGTGTGEFLVCAKKNGWEGHGVEPNIQARTTALNKGLNVLEKISDIKNSKYDVITLWHVLEHLPNLEESIKAIEAMLKPEGILIVAVPNYRSYDAKYYKNYWAAYDVPRHLWHFSRASMNKIFSKNIKPKKIYPMFYDSFYVSLLSEKNKKGKLSFLKAFWIGLRSNISAWSTKEYSSLIYSFKKDELNE